MRTIVVLWHMFVKASFCGTPVRFKHACSPHVYIFVKCMQGILRMYMYIATRILWTILILTKRRDIR